MHVGVFVGVRECVWSGVKKIQAKSSDLGGVSGDGHGC